MFPINITLIFQVSMFPPSMLEPDNNRLSSSQLHSSFLARVRTHTHAQLEHVETRMEKWRTAAKRKY